MQLGDDQPGLAAYQAGEDLVLGADGPSTGAVTTAQAFEACSARRAVSEVSSNWL